LPGAPGISKLEIGRGQPLAQHPLESAEREEVVLCVTLDRARPRDGGHRIDQVLRRVGRAARVAAVTVLIGRLALRARALDETVRQEHLPLGVVELLDRARGDHAGGLEPLVHRVHQLAVLLGVRRAVVVERDAEVREVLLMLGVHAVDERRGIHALVQRAQHDRRAVGVVGADVPARVPLHPQRPRPDVGLDVLHEMPEVDRTVRVGQGGRDEDVAWGHSGSR
jgi:hypothetical protein